MCFGITCRDVCEAAYGEMPFENSGGMPFENSKTSALVGLVAFNSLFFISLTTWGFLGTYSAFSIGLAVMGVVLGNYFSKLAIGHFRERNIYIVGITSIACAFILVGALGCGGVLTGTQLAWGIVGISLGSVVVKTICVAIHAYRNS